ncbi:hypothetical protein SOVF_050340 [Spinacia oleracea]|nr:hypothetical protein SOVF_050340 [Spinacia oleracea]
MDPVPSNFKGVCDGGENFPPSLCNKKIVGVRYFAGMMSKTENKSLSARDDFGHGTHTASTIAGRTLNQNVSFFGYAKGEATGMAPKARLAIYKVCWSFGCSSSDVLAGIDKAVEDGVDVISLSLGGPLERFTDDTIALGAFGAFQKGVFVSASAGNSGPIPGTLSNVAPWITAVGASTIDRTFRADVILDNEEVLSGSSLYTGGPLPKNKTFPLVHFTSNYSMEYCYPGSLGGVDVKGKIVICSSPALSSRVGRGVEVQLAGGVGVIVALNDPTVDVNDTVKSDPYLIPGVTIPFFETRRLLHYIKNKQVKQATIVFRGTRYGEKPAPMVASFSSRGPNTLSKYVLKPDVIAPGVDILAGWPKNLSPSGLDIDHRRSDYNIMSGTSMSCPHVSGLAALLKSAHMDWTPTMIRSALMTTAYTGYHHEMNKTKTTRQNGHQLSYWVSGAGHVNPEKANDPGLVFDLSEDDYVQFLCASNYNSTEIQIIVKKPVKCDDETKVKEWDLNYPALIVPTNSKGKEIEIVRTVKNVESGSSTYTAKVAHPKGLSVSVSPLELSFKAINETRKFSVKVSAFKGFKHDEDAMSSITWTDGNNRNVTIPLIVVV